MNTEFHIKIRTAYHLLIERAAKYTPKSDACWVCYEDSDGRSETFEDMNDSTFCEDCIQEVLEKAAIEHKDNLPSDFVEFDYQVESMPEKDDFLHCDECGEHIDCSNLWSNQELEHWIALQEIQWIDSLKDSHNCYELKQLLDTTYGAVEKYPRACLKIAECIIQHYPQTKL